MVFSLLVLSGGCHSILRKHILEAFAVNDAELSTKIPLERCGESNIPNLKDYITTEHSKTIILGSKVVDEVDDERIPLKTLLLEELRTVFIALTSLEWTEEKLLRDYRARFVQCIARQVRFCKPDQLTSQPIKQWRWQSRCSRSQ